MKKPAVIATALSLLFVIACQKVSTTTYDCTGTAPTYTTDIKPIMDANCALSGCHNAASREAGFDLSNYNGVVSASASAAFLGAIEHLSRYDAMPRNASKLDDALIKKIYCWANNGKAQ